MDGLICLGDRVAVRPEERASISEGGIHLPDEVKAKDRGSKRGTVVSVGPGKVLEDGRISEMPVVAGDVVIFSKYSGSEFKFGGEDLLMLRAEDLLAVVEG